MKTADQLAIEYTRLGNYRMAIEHQLLGIALFSKGAPEPLQVWRSYFLIAAPLNLLGLNMAAADFQQEALRVAKDARISYSICRSYISLGLIYGSRRDYVAATENVKAAFDLANTMPSSASRADTLGYSSLQLGHLYRQAGDFGKAIESYEQSIKIYEGLNFKAFSYAAHKGKLLSCLAQGGCPSIDRVLQTALELFERHRSKILEESNRDSFFDAEQNLYDVAIDFAYTVGGDHQTAFEFSERSRARSLLDLTGTETRLLDVNGKQDIGFTTVSQPLGLAEIRQRMPDQAQLLQYSVLDRKLIIWLVSKSGVSHSERPINAKELRDKVLVFLRLISEPYGNGEAELSRASADLYELLIKPVEPALDRSKRLHIVPDKILNYLPFSALISEPSGRYLMEEFTPTVSPSSSMFIVCSENGQRKEAVRAEKLLSVGDPTFDRAAFPTLPALPSARREAKEIAAYYSPARVLTGDEAVKNHVVAELGRADVAHFALHSVIDEQSPLRSKLLMTKRQASDEPAKHDILQVYEIYKLRQSRPRLVVLSSCQSAAERYYAGEGMIGISRPFLAIGVPLVVASLWPVDSNATEQLMLATANALVRAQREMLDNPDSRYRHPFYWAAFMTLGGYTRF
jgi:CHAT domain-containing protein